MKFFFIPAAALSLLLALSLWNARAMEAAVEPWRGALSEAVEAAERGDWERAERLVEEVRTGWNEKRAWFHIVAPHDELEEADTLFAQAAGFARERESGEFRADMAALSGQLLLISERQQLSLRNIL